MMGCFKIKPQMPAELVRRTRDLLIYIDQNQNISDSKRAGLMDELCALIRQLKCILYGTCEAEPVAEACAQLTREFFRENTLRLLISSFQMLNLEARKDATLLVANLQRQQVQSKLVASYYLEENKDLLVILISG
ncbi:putative MO25-like protein [Platanthera guangdongensis]|uniref:MO25-like protein n=1 Tax=Platanthera guangdongensis TaxID=2320717 RepID=A0ABR2MDU0_9ASPA